MLNLDKLERDFREWLDSPRYVSPEGLPYWRQIDEKVKWHVTERILPLIAECRTLRWLTEKLEAENERYRKALEDINSRTKDAKAAAIAREVLGGK